MLRSSLAGSKLFQILQFCLQSWLVQNKEPILSHWEFIYNTWEWYATFGSEIAVGYHLILHSMQSSREMPAGTPRFHQWTSDRHALKHHSCLASECPSTHNLYMDMNGIFDTFSQQTLRRRRRDGRLIIERILQHIDSIHTRKGAEFCPPLCGRWVLRCQNCSTYSTGTTAWNCWAARAYQLWKWNWKPM